MAKKKSFPKAPKAGASIDTLKAYQKRCADIKKFNDTIERDIKAKQSIRDSVKKMKAK